MSPGKDDQLGEGLRACEVFNAKKDWSGRKFDGNGSDNGSEVIPSIFSSQFVATGDVQARICGKVPATLTDTFDLASG